MPKSGAQPTFFRARPRSSTPGAAARYSNEWLAWHGFHQRILRRRSDRLHHGTADYGPASGAHTSGIQAARHAVGQHRLRGMHAASGAPAVWRARHFSPLAFPPGTCSAWWPRRFSTPPWRHFPSRCWPSGVLSHCWRGKRRPPGSARNGLPVRHRDRIALLGRRDAWLRPRICLPASSWSAPTARHCFCCWVPPSRCGAAQPRAPSTCRPW